MARRKKAVTGLTSEIKAQLRLAEDPNLLVFVPLGGLGPVDIVTLNMTTGEYNAYDVKSKNYRKAKEYVASDGYKRKLKGTFISRGSTKEQKKLNVRIIYE
jgi:hypothetical protein